MNIFEENVKSPVGYNPQLGKDEHAAKASQLNRCCIDTINLHASNNPIMVCQECKQLIKCFKDERAYRNYMVFCKSRGRKVLAAEYSTYHVVVFRSYETLR